MDKNTMEHIEQKIFDIIISKAKESFNNQEYLSFEINDLSEQLQLETNLLHEYMPVLCKKLLRRNIVINHNDSSWEQISILISINYGHNTNLTLELNPEIKSYLQYLDRQ